MYEQKEVFYLKIRRIAPEFYDNLRSHHSWVWMMYDFATNPNMSLHSRIKRKYASSDQFHFYGVGPYENSNIYSLVSKMSYKVLHLINAFRSTAKVE
ncbi:hypothetical protein DICVIV_13710 [Dictyocaulus viviparus]|uniref:Uncharacterized protein n=1 Tax=Dictyocaulus viviparus TaxID=29172 RepID=A0A0D8X753_DICVI|nr:hypothetical protein DICVIV_13710 [Dictyocaulus viviparus]